MELDANISHEPPPFSVPHAIFIYRNLDFSYDLFPYASWPTWPLTDLIKFILE